MYDWANGFWRNVTVNGLYNFTYELQTIPTYYPPHDIYEQIVAKPKMWVCLSDRSARDHCLYLFCDIKSRHVKIHFKNMFLVTSPPCFRLHIGAPVFYYLSCIQWKMVCFDIIMLLHLFVGAFVSVAQKYQSIWSIYYRKNICIMFGWHA